MIIFPHYISINIPRLPINRPSPDITSLTFSDLFSELTSSIKFTCELCHAKTARYQPLIIWAKGRGLNQKKNCSEHF